MAEQFELFPSLMGNEPFEILNSRSCSEPLEAKNVRSVLINFWPNTFSLVLTISLLLSGLTSAAASAEELLSRSPERGGVGLGLQRELQLREELEVSHPSGQTSVKRPLNEAGRAAIHYRHR